MGDVKLGKVWFASHADLEQGEGEGCVHGGATIAALRLAEGK